MIVFTNSRLREKLLRHEITMTIRGATYPQRLNISEGKIVDVYFKGRRVGKAIVTKIKYVAIRNLTEQHARFCGYESLSTLLKALKRYMRFHYRLDKEVSVIEFVWIR